MKRLILLNKTDLPTRLSDEELAAYLNEEEVLPISVMTSQGIDVLEEQIVALFFDEGVSEKDATYVSNNRHIGLLEEV